MTALAIGGGSVVTVGLFFLLIARVPTKRGREVRKTISRHALAFIGGGLFVLLVALSTTPPLDAQTPPPIITHSIPSRRRTPQMIESEDGEGDGEMASVSFADLIAEQNVSAPYEEALHDNCWEYDSEQLIVRYRDEAMNYEIELEHIDTSAAALDWIAQISQKTWETPEVVGDLVRLLDAILDFQGHYCSFGSERGPVNVKELIRDRH